ncbi:MAG: hypothetical protein GIKADHBN_02860 [Phycisphaerales bacterium]|nr:hypothetical protein [Phycisphaerales bacterium]
MERHLAVRLVLIWALVSLWAAGAAGGQPAPAPGGPEAPSNLGVPSATSRRELAEAYIRFDAAFMASTLDDAQRRELHKAFDAATMQFFSGNLGAVVTAVEALTARLAGADAPPPEVDPGMTDAEIAAWRDRLRELIASAPRDAAPEGSVAWDIAKARADLVDRADPRTDSARFLAGQRALAEQVEREVQELAKGNNPYRDHPGEIWRPVVHKGTTVPCRVYAPPAGREKARPLVIVLHGAGGDEAMFLHAYGAGQIKQLADEHGFIVASPLTYPLMGNGELFDVLVGQIASDYSIDTDRVYVVGHSMGGGAAVMLASLRGGSIGAAAGICGGTAIGLKTRSCPVLLVGGEVDPIIRAASLEKMAERTTRNGHRMEYREHPGGGHTLTVNEVLPEVVRWLLDHRRRPDAPAGEK